MTISKALALVALLLVAVVVIGYLPTTGKVAAPAQNDQPAAAAATVREFALDSFVVFEDGKPRPQFSVKELAVMKGDRVRLLINTTSGTHNFNIDELNVHAETPTGEVTIVEFVASEAGELVYYCSKPGHRQNGHWGTLTVLDRGT